MQAIYAVSFRCFYGNGVATNHFQDLPLSDIPRWLDSYKFTHPACISISCKIWFSSEVQK